MKPIQTILDFYERKKQGDGLSMLTCYDHWTAKILNDSPVDTLLVGDSVSMVLHGHPNTLAADTDMMRLHTSAVARGAPNKFIVSDMPFLSVRKGIQYAVETAEVLVRAGAQAVKIEGILGHEDIIRHLVESGIPVMGHLGLTPQFYHQLGGFKVQGRDTETSDLLFSQAKKLQELGVFCVVLECVPSLLAEKITQALSISTIGIGAGEGTDGQVLVLQDMLGGNPQFQPKFLRLYEDLHAKILKAATTFDHDVKEGRFPSAKESYV